MEWDTVDYRVENSLRATHYGSRPVSIVITISTASVTVSKTVSTTDLAPLSYYNSDTTAHSPIQKNLAFPLPNTTLLAALFVTGKGSSR